MSRLFSDEFLRRVAQLRIVARQVPGGGRHAEQRSADRGSGMEFRDFRAYAPGDDLRRIDWNIFRRSGRVFLRLFEEPEDLPVYILLDVSDSMFFDTPPRADAARQLAGALTVISLGQLDRVTIYPLGAQLGDPFRPAAGMLGQHAALDFLERLGPAGPTDLGRALRRFAGLGLRSGLAVVVSDFFDPRGPAAATAALGACRHRLLLVQLAQESDENPSLEGEFTLVDCETGAELEVAAAPPALERYRAAYRDFAGHLLSFAARRRAAHLRLDAAQPVLEQLGGLFHNRTFVT